MPSFRNLRSSPRLHLNHHSQAVAVDCIWLLNPSAQAGSLTANWRQTACANIAAHLVDAGVTRQADAFAFFDQACRGVVVGSGLTGL